jgi:putative membrane protein
VLRRLAQTWVFNIAAIFVASYFVSGIDYAHRFWVLVLAGLVFGLVNMILKPVVTLMALPVIVLTLGLALFLVNLLMLYVTTWIVGPFRIESFGDAIWGTLIIWVVNATLHALFGLERRRRRRLRRR